MGRIFRQTYKVKGPDGNWLCKETDCWHIEWTDETGRTRRRKAASDAAKARDALRQAEADVLARKNGLPTRSFKDVPLAELRTKYLAHLQGRAGKSHVKRSKLYISQIMAGCKMLTMRDCIPERLERYLNELPDQGLGSKAINDRLVYFRAMLNWAVRAGELPYNPILSVQKRKTTGKIHPRRALTDDEISRLLAAALDGPIRRARKVYQNRPRKDGTFKPAELKLRTQAELADVGRHVALTYRLLLDTGLRKNEARQLTWADLDLDAGLLHCRAEWTKNARDAELPLVPALWDALKDWKAKHPNSTKPADRVARIGANFRRIFEDDRKAAGIVKKDAAGRFFDIHAMRHTFGTRLGALPGVDPKTVQSLMRHATPNITFALYVHADKNRLKSAVASLPALKPASGADGANGPEQVLMTGTDDRDLTPDDDPKNGGGSPRIRLGKSESVCKASAINSIPNEGNGLSHPRGQGFESLSAHHSQHCQNVPNCNGERQLQDAGAGSPVARNYRTCHGQIAVLRII